MRRTVFTGGNVFDGTGSVAARADVVVEGDRIVAVGTGLDGDESVDCTGRTILPGLNRPRGSKRSLTASNARTRRAPNIGS